MHQMTYEFFKNFNQNSAADCGIPKEFLLEFPLILNGAMSADYV